jgi:DNA-binding FrmR family transcriptional regulator
MKHTSHPDIIKRLKRAEGHLRSLIGMMQAERPCVELAQQLHAIERAIANAKRDWSTIISTTVSMTRSPVAALGQKKL